jgi:cytochrome b6-f complex iron-sulfur subunit
MGRFLIPNISFDPPTRFSAGKPTEYDIGVDERWKAKFKVWLVRDSGGFYALSTVCTHLGCTPNWFKQDSKFKCPCHGSGFQPSGRNFEGPAPRPLERFNIEMAADGNIYVDKSKKFRWEMGQWELPGSYLKFST